MNNKNNELEFNKKNREDFENLMKDSSTNLDGYWDKNNPVVRIILIFLAVFIIVGAASIIISYMNQ